MTDAEKATFVAIAILLILFFCASNCFLTQYFSSTEAMQRSIERITAVGH